MAGDPGYCSACGARLSPDAQFCHKCGKAVTSPGEGTDEEGRGTLSAAAGGSEPGRAASSGRSRTAVASIIVAAVVLIVVVVFFAVVRTQSSSSDSKRRNPHAAAIFRACSRQLGPLLKGLRAMDSRLDVGLNESDYLDELGNVNVAYGQIDVDNESPKCVSAVGVPAEDALNDYIKAGNAWNKCISKLSCSNAKVRPTLQADWALATAKIDQAERGLKHLKTG
jgi:hypothetical protein